MKRVLTNVALDFPNLSYYQGMNYLVIYIYSVFEDELMTYKFLHFISDKFLQH
jgi:Rab-GTPase-TBC domain